MFNRPVLYLVIALTLMFAGCIITGKVVDGNGIGVQGVTVNLSGAASMTTITDSNGKYQFGTVENMLSTGSYTVTPSGDVSPESRTVSITTQTLGELGDVPWPVGGVDFVGSQRNGLWIGNWVQVNFLGTDEDGNLEQWDADSTDPEGIGFVADISESEWVERDDYGKGCISIFSYSVNGDRFSMRGKSTTCYFPIDFTNFTDSGRLEFPDNNTMIQWYDYPPGSKNTIAAFKWKRR